MSGNSVCLSNDKKIKNAFYYLTSEYRFRQDVKNYFAPKQKWLTKKIPNHWCDKSDLIPIILFEMIVHFVEEEMDMVGWDWNKEVQGGHLSQEHADKIKQTEATILEIYKWIKTDKPVMEKEYQRLVSLSFPKHGNLCFYLTKEQREFLLVAHTIEIEISKKDQEMLYKVIEVRESLWT